MRGAAELARDDSQQWAWPHEVRSARALEAQEGRLFRPLAFTKTFSMFFAAILGIVLVPVLMAWLIRGKITPETKNPINRFLIKF